MGSNRHGYVDSFSARGGVDQSDSMGKLLGASQRASQGAERKMTITLLLAILVTLMLLAMYAMGHSHGFAAGQQDYERKLR